MTVACCVAADCGHDRCYVSTQRQHRVPLKAAHAAQRHRKDSIESESDGADADVRVSAELTHCAPAYLSCPLPAPAGLGARDVRSHEPPPLAKFSTAAAVKAADALAAPAGAGRSDDPLSFLRARSHDAAAVSLPGSAALPEAAA